MITKPYLHNFNNLFPCKQLLHCLCSIDGWFQLPTIALGIAGLQLRDGHAEVSGGMEDKQVRQVITQLLEAVRHSQLDHTVTNRAWNVRYLVEQRGRKERRGRGRERRGIQVWYGSSCVQVLNIHVYSNIIYTNK